MSEPSEKSSNDHNYMKSAVKGYGHCSKHLYHENTVYGIFFYQIKVKVLSTPENIGGWK